MWLTGVRCEVVCPSRRLEEVRRTFQHPEVGLGEDEGVDNGGSCSCCALLSFLQLVCPPACVQSWSVTPVNSKMLSSARMLLPPAHPNTTAFGSIGSESNEWARGLRPAGLVSAGGDSGVKVTVASTVRDSASLLLKPSILCWPRGTPSKHWALRASVGMAGARTGVTEAGADAIVDEVVPLRRRVSVQCRSKLYGCGELGVAMGTGRAVDEGGCQIFRIATRV